MVMIVWRRVVSHYIIYLSQNEEDN